MDRCTDNVKTQCFWIRQPAVCKPNNIRNHSSCRRTVDGMLVYLWAEADTDKQLFTPKGNLDQSP